MMLDPTMRILALIQAMQAGPGRDRDMIVKAVQPETFGAEMRALGLEIADRMDAQRARYGALLRPSAPVAPDYTQAEVEAEFAVSRGMLRGAVSHTCVTNFATGDCACNFSADDR